LREPRDYVIATGGMNTLQDFVAESFSTLGLDWQDHVISNPSLIRPSEIMVSRGNATLAARSLGWMAKKRMREIVRMMISYQGVGS